MQTPTTMKRICPAAASRRARGGVAFLLALATLALGSSCQSPLVSAAEKVIAKAISPSIAVTRASDGASLSSGGALDFGTVSMGGGVSIQLTVKNTGKSALVILSSKLSLAPDSGTDSGIFHLVDPQDLNLSPNASGMLTISFSPIMAQTYGATLTMTTNDVSTPTFALGLTGTGLATAKAMTSFALQSPAETGVIDEANKTIFLNVPYGIAITSLVAVFESSGVQVSVGSANQVSGQTSNDFSKTLIYAVTAQDGSTANYAVTVTVGSTSPLVTTSAVGTIAAASAMSGGTIASECGSTVTEAGICWSTSQNPTKSDSYLASDQTSGTFTVRMTGLSPATLYYVRAYAINGVGMGYGPQVSFITSVAIPTLTTAPASSITSSGAVLGGAIVATGGSAATVTGVCVSTSANATLATSGVLVFSGSATSGSFTANATGLSANTAYFARAYASNSAGTAYGDQVSFITSIALPTVTTASASSIASSSAILGGAIVATGGSAATVTGVCVSTSVNATISTSGALVFSGSSTSGSFTASATGLTAGTTYYARAYATNSAGTAYGDQVSFTTAIAPPTVTTASASSIASSSAILGGAIVATGGSAATVTGVCVSTSVNATISTSGVLVFSGSSTSGSFTASATGLTAGTTYYARAYATNSAGTAYGDQVGFTTLAVASTVTTASASSVTSSGAMLGGTIVATGGSAATVTGVCVSTAANATLSTLGVLVFSGSATSGSFTASATGLSPSTTYYARAYATNSAGTGYGSDATFTTSAAAPTVTTGSSMSSIAMTSAMGSGTVSSTGGATLTATGLCWSSTNSTPTTSDSYATSSAPTSSFTASLSGLSAGTIYYVRAYATNSAGTGYGPMVSFITQPDTPVISSVSPVGYLAGSGELDVSWSAAIGASVYNVYASLANTFATASVISGGSGLPSTVTSCTLTGLTDYLTYYVWVVASNASGSTTSACSSGKVGIPVTAVTLQRSADYVPVSGGRTTDTLIWDSTQGMSSIDTLYAEVIPVNATNNATILTSTGGVTLTTGGVISLSSAKSGTVKATPADGKGGTEATVTVSYISAAKGATNYTGPGGGKIFYDKGSYSDGWRYLEVYYNSGSGTVLGVPWGATFTTTGATLTALGAGKENTDAIISKYGTTGSYGTGYMAYKCRYAFSNATFADWYLPSYDEVDKIRTVLGFANYTQFSTSTEMDSNYIYIYYNNYTNNSLYYWSNCIKSYGSYYSLPSRRF
jgi:hypothetical protein